MASVRKIKYGKKVTPVTIVMREIAEEIIDLTGRMNEVKFDASAKMVAQHQDGLIERIQIRADLIQRLSQLL